MTITRRGVGTVAASTTTATPGLPTGTAEGDILLCFCDTAKTQAVTPPGTWAIAPDGEQEPATGANAFRLTVLWKRAEAGESAPTIADPGTVIIARIVGYAGCVTTGSPFDVTAGGNEDVLDTSASIPGATTTGPERMIVAAIATVGPDAIGTAEFSAWTNASLASITEAVDDTSNISTGSAIGAADGIKTTAGAYSATTVTQATASRKGMWSGALIPESGTDGTGTLTTCTPTVTPNALAGSVAHTPTTLTPTATTHALAGSVDQTLTSQQPTVTVNTPAGSVAHELAASTPTVTTNVLDATTATTLTPTAPTVSLLALAGGAGGALAAVTPTATVLALAGSDAEPRARPRHASVTVAGTYSAQVRVSDRAKVRV